MYDLIPCLLGGMMILLGTYMSANPKKATKEELRNDENVVKKTKRNGFVVIGCGIVLIILGIIKGTLL